MAPEEGVGARAPEKGAKVDGARVVGVHFIADISNCERNFTEAGHARALALEAVARAGMTPIGEVAATVSDGAESGATVVIVVVPLKESHLSIHTWPELKFAAVDLFTCGDQRLGKQAFEAVLDWFGGVPVRYEIPRLVVE